MSEPLAPTATAVTIGIDVSKHHLDAHRHPDGGSRRFVNGPPGHAELIAWIAPLRPGRVVFEATGAYHRGLQKALAEAGLPFVKVNPKQARSFAGAIGRRAKTDAIDAAMLARFGAAAEPEVRPAPDPAMDDLAELLAARRALVKDRVAALNRGKNLTLPLLKRQNLRRLKEIEAQIGEIDREHARLVAKNERLQARFDILLSIPGLGAASALALLVDMPELGTLDARRTGSLGGLAPMTRQSGRWQGKSYVQGGRAQLRQALYMPALVAIRFNPPLKATYQALRKAGKPAKVAIVAVMRKLLVLANALLRDNRTWTAERAKAPAEGQP